MGRVTSEFPRFSYFVRLQINHKTDAESGNYRHKTKNDYYETTISFTTVFIVSMVASLSAFAYDVEVDGI